MSPLLWLRGEVAGRVARVVQDENWGLTLNPLAADAKAFAATLVFRLKSKRAARPGGPLDRARHSVQRAFVFTITSPAVLLSVPVVSLGYSAEARPAATSGC
jgi:hypothetical protein